MPGIDKQATLVLHCDGPDGSTAFPDSSLVPKTFTANGGAQVDTAESKFGGASYLGDGAATYLSAADNADFELGNGVFTLDCWVRFNTFTIAEFFICKWTTGTSQRSYYWGYQHSTTSMDFRFSTDGTSSTLLSVTWTPSTGVWYHVAAVRTGGNLVCYVDGSSIGSNAISGTFFNGTSTLNIGAFNAGTGGWVDGWMDEVRISKGIARWTANFTPPTAAYSVTRNAAVNHQNPAVLMKKLRSGIVVPRLWTPERPKLALA